MKKIRIFALVLAVLMIIAATVVYVGAEEVTTAVTEAETDLRDLHGGDITLTERIPYAVQGVVTGMLMIFAVLILLTVIVSVSKYFLAPPMPKAQNEEKPKATEPTPAPAPAPAPVAVPVQTSDDQLIAVLTAAVAAMIDGNEEYRSEFASGFRVVSFKRVSSNGAWNKN